MDAPLPTSQNVPVFTTAEPKARLSYRPVLSDPCLLARFAATARSAATQLRYDTLFFDALVDTTEVSYRF